MNQSANVEAIAGTLAEQMPAVQEHVIAAEEQKAAANANKDAAGQSFDPAVHAVNSDGSPRLTKAGEYAKRRGRPPSHVAKPAPAVSGEVVDKTAQARASGAVAANMLVVFGMMLGGDEWKPRTDPMDEKAMLEAAFGDYFAATGLTDLPPGWALAFACGAYAVPRFTMPVTRSRVGKFKDWCAAKWIKWRAKKAGYNVDVRPDESPRE